MASPPRQPSTTSATLAGLDRGPVQLIRQPGHPASAIAPRCRTVDNGSNQSRAGSAGHAAPVLATPPAAPLLRSSLLVRGHCRYIQPMPLESFRAAGLAPASRVLVTVGAAVAVVAGLYAGRSLIGPFAIAALIVMVCHPLRYPLERRGVPSAVATAAVVAGSYLILLVIGGLVLIAVVELVNLVPQYTDQVASAQSQLVATVELLGLDDTTASQLGGVVSPGTLLKLVSGVSSAVVGGAAALFFVFAYVIFMAADAAGFGPMVSRFANSRSTVIAVFNNYTHAVRRYLAVNTVFGAIVAVLDGIVLVAIGVPGALLWVILAFVTNYIPNVGFVLALIPPALLALLTGGWPAALLVVAAYCIINVTMQTFIQPKFVSDAVRLSLTLTFASVLFWALILGPVGAILAIPATLFLRALLLESDPGAIWARWMTGDRAEPELETASPSEDPPG